MYKYVNFLILIKYSPEFNKNQGLEEHKPMILSTENKTNVKQFKQTMIMS